MADRSRNCVLLLTVLVLFQAGMVSAQQIVDKTVAVVGERDRFELITYSDLLWQLALQPNVPLDPPRPEDLNRALQTLINQRLFALEAQRLPRAAPNEKEIAAKITETLAFFPSAAVFEQRLKQVGFDSVKDETFERIIAQRVAIEKYVDFRFGSFVVVTAVEEADYYRDVFVPNFKRRSPGVLVPTLDERRVEIHQILNQQKIATAIERFLDDAKKRVQIEILLEV